MRSKNRRNTLFFKLFLVETSFKQQKILNSKNLAAPQKQLADVKTCRSVVIDSISSPIPV